MIYKTLGFYCILLAICLDPVRSARLPARDNPLEHKIGHVFQRISTAKVKIEQPAILNDVRSAVFLLRQTQQQIHSVLAVQTKMQEKLNYWISKSDSDDPDDNSVPEHESNHLIENQMAHLLQRISSSASQAGWIKTSSRIKSEPPSLYSAIKEAASALQETRLQISSILAVQFDIQEKLVYWQSQLASNEDTRPSSPPSLPCMSDDTESKSTWFFKAFDCNSSLHAIFWLNSGINWNWRSSLYGNQTALQLAVNRNWDPVVDMLIKEGADCRIKTADETLLHQAIREGADSHLIRLLTSGCDVNATDGLQKTALHLAVENNRTDVIDFLVRQGRANTEAQDLLGYRPIHLAVRSPQVVSKLIGFGVNIGAEAISGMTPLHMAVIENQLDTVEILVKAGAKVGVSRDKYGNTPLDYAAMLGQRGGPNDQDMQTLLGLYATIDEYFLDMPSDE